MAFLAGDDGTDSKRVVFSQTKGLREIGSPPAVLPDATESRRRIITSKRCVVRPENYYSKLCCVRERRPWIEKLTQSFSNEKLTRAKHVVFRRENLPAIATLAVSSAATGMLLTAVASPVICFGFYVVFITAIAGVTASLGSLSTI